MGGNAEYPKHLGKRSVESIGIGEVCIQFVSQKHRYLTWFDQDGEHFDVPPGNLLGHGNIKLFLDPTRLAGVTRKDDCNEVRLSDRMAYLFNQGFTDPDLSIIDPHIDTMFPKSIRKLMREELVLPAVAQKHRRHNSSPSDFRLTSRTIATL